MTREHELLKSAISEIRGLRRKNELMRARLGVYDQMMLLFHIPPAFPNQGYSPDLTWEIEKHIDEKPAQKENHE
jgi:hypothetical protein